MTEMPAGPGGATVAPVARPDIEWKKDWLDRVRKREKGNLASLRRNAGNTLATARGITWFYSHLAAVPASDRTFNADIYLLVAALAVGDKAFVSRGRSAPGNFGWTMRRLSDGSGTDLKDRRFQILLDAHFEVEGPCTGGGEMAFRLRQAARLAIQKEVPVDWAQLLVDLLSWEHPGRWVQKRWASAFYGDASQATAPQPTDDSTPDTKES